jgi:agmatine deiminase
MKRRNFVKLGSSALLLNGVGMTSSAATSSDPFNGFWMPEESDPHTRTFMQWPVNRQVHPDGVFLRMLQQSIADIANTISELEPVVMLMDPKYKKKARRLLGDQVDIWDIPTDDLWCRDSGPVFVRDPNGNLAVASLNFNGWGNKQTHRNDGKVAKRIAEHMNVPYLDSGVVGEAGGLEIDGHGTLIAHESSWVNLNRNSQSKAVIETALLKMHGAEKMIWAPGIAGADITDYHIDSLARFSEPGKVVIQMPSERRANDPWSHSAFETYDILERSKDAHGADLELIVIPEPYDTRITSEDFVASYVNYYVCNGAVITAEFGDKSADSKAVEILKELYPTREIITLNVDPIGETGGGIHCATQQQPAV